MWAGTQIVWESPPAARGRHMCGLDWNAWNSASEGGWREQRQAGARPHRVLEDPASSGWVSRQPPAALLIGHWWTLYRFRGRHEINLWRSNYRKTTVTYLYNCHLEQGSVSILPSTSQKCAWQKKLSLQWTLKERMGLKYCRELWWSQGCLLVPVTPVLPVNKVTHSFQECLGHPSTT